MENLLLIVRTVGQIERNPQWAFAAAAERRREVIENRASGLRRMIKIKELLLFFPL